MSAVSAVVAVMKQDIRIRPFEIGRRPVFEFFVVDIFFFLFFLGGSGAVTTATAFNVTIFVIVILLAFACAVGTQVVECTAVGGRRRW